MLMMIPQYKTAAKFAQFVQCCKTFMHLFEWKPDKCKLLTKMAGIAMILY